MFKLAQALEQKWQLGFNTPETSDTLGSALADDKEIECEKCHKLHNEKELCQPLTGNKT
jgi:hypothetical protein